MTWLECCARRPDLVSGDLVTQRRRVAVLVPALTLAAAFVAGLSPGTAAAQVTTPAIPWDVNGDGYADLGVAAIIEDLNTIGNAGIFHLLPGGADGVTGTGSKAYTQDTAGVPDVAQSGD